jgi:hypothetical protein
MYSPTELWLQLLKTQQKRRDLTPTRGMHWAPKVGGKDVSVASRPHVSMCIVDVFRRKDLAEIVANVKGANKTEVEARWSISQMHQNFCAMTRGSETRRTNVWCR